MSLVARDCVDDFRPANALGRAPTLARASTRLKNSGSLFRVEPDRAYIVPEAVGVMITQNNPRNQP